MKNTLKTLIAISAITLCSFTTQAQTPQDSMKRQNRTMTPPQDSIRRGTTTPKTPSTPPAKQTGRDSTMRKDPNMKNRMDTVPNGTIRDTVR